MGDPFRTLTPGDPVVAGEGPFNSQWHNLATEAIRVSQRATPPGMTSDDVVKERDTEIWIANITEATLDEYRPAGLGDLAIYPSDDGDFRERLCFLTQKLKSGRPFGIVQQPVGAGRLYACKLTAGPGGQPPNKKWMRLVGDPSPWDVLRTYFLGEQVIYIAPAGPWTDGNNYVVGDRVDVGGIIYRCVAAHVASTENVPPETGHWQLDKGKKYISLVKHAGMVPPANPSFWLPSGPHRGVWNKGDTYTPGEVIVEPQLGRIIIDGVTRAWINVKNAAHQHANIVGGELRSTIDGPIDILWRQGGLGNSWAVVRLCCGFLTPPVATSEAEVTSPVMTSGGVGQFIYRPGGALITGATNIAGAGMHTYPARTGSAALSLAMTRSNGIGNVYTPTPSGSLYTASMDLSGVGIRTTPPIGNGNLKPGPMSCFGLGTRSAPTRSGSGSFSLPAFSLFSSAGSGGGSITVAAMFVAKMTNPLLQGSTGRWVYDWIEQTINPTNGDYQDLAGGKTGNTTSGPFMRERNNNLVATPVFSLARLRGVWSSQPLYDFEHCCSKGVELANSALVLGAMMCDGVGTFVVPPPKVGSGDLLLGVMACAGNGYASTYSVNIGTGTPQIGLTICTGIGLTSTYSVNVGKGKPQLGLMLLAGLGNANPPVFMGGNALQLGLMTGTGNGLSSGFSVGVGKGMVQNAGMLGTGIGNSSVPVFAGSANLPFALMTANGIGLSSAFSVNVGLANTSIAAMTCTGAGESTLPVFVGNGDLEVAALIIGAVGDSVGPLIVKDHFTATNGTDATTRDPDVGPRPTSTSADYKIQSNKLTNAAGNLGDGTYHALIYECMTAHVDVSADISNANSESPPQFDLGAIFVRWIDGDNFFALEVFDGVAQFYRLQDGDATVLGSAAFAAQDDTNYRYRVIASGNSFEIYIDETLLFTVTDAAFKASTKHGVAVNADPQGSSVTTIDNLEIFGFPDPLKD